ncbi:MAG: metalloregulator ArsR/SmtB family transcription factor [Candidatus Nanopelagicales bacterium]
MTMKTSMADGKSAVVESTPPGDSEALVAAAALFRGLADPSRLAILRHLMHGEHNVRELTEHLGLAQSTVSEHLRCLLGCGLARVRVEGRASIYSLAVEPKARDFLIAADGLLAATGAAAVLSPLAGRRA